MRKLLSVLLAVALFALPAVAALASGGASVFAVVFRENPTTGYTWAYVNSDDSVLAVDDQGYAEPANPIPGAGSDHTWVISGAGQGEATVTFTYAHSWESDPSDPVIAYSFAVGEDLIPQLKSVTGLPEKYMPEYAVVQLTGNPTTGYLWTSSIDAEGVLSPGSDFFTADANPENLVGAGGVQTFIFGASGPGEATVTFEYARSFEPGAAPAATVTVSYTVDDQLNVTQTAVGGDYNDYAADVNVTAPAE